MKKKRLIAFAIVVLLLTGVFSFRLARHGDLIAQTTRTFPAVTTQFETTIPLSQRWPLLLVNKANAVPANYVPPLLTLSNGQQIDSRIYPDLQELFDAARSAGFSLSAAYCYRSKAQQREVLNERIAQYQAEGLSANEAKKQALEFVAKPGHSEHELGLAVDIHAEGKTDAKKLFAWLQTHAYLYGFIERYPEDKTEITGISYERWHYRYVGRTAAETIFREHWALEEYLTHEEAFNQSPADRAADETTVTAQTQSRAEGST